MASGNLDEGKVCTPDPGLSGLIPCNSLIEPVMGDLCCNHDTLSWAGTVLCVTAILYAVCTNSIQNRPWNLHKLNQEQTWWGSVGLAWQMNARIKTQPATL